MCFCSTATAYYQQTATKFTVVKLELLLSLIITAVTLMVVDRRWFWCFVFGFFQTHTVVNELIDVLSFIKWKCYASIRLANRPSMWCLVSQPNSVILEVDVDPKAKGQECLEKVFFDSFTGVFLFACVVNVFCAMLGKVRLNRCQVWV
jgi:hypothetical protein